MIGLYLILISFDGENDGITVDSGDYLCKFYETIHKQSSHIPCIFKCYKMSPKIDFF